MSLEEIFDRMKMVEPLEGGPLPEGTRALDLLQMVYRGEYKATPRQIRAAVEALAFESPKLTAVAHFDGNFAEQLDKAIERRSMKLIEHQVPEAKPEPVPTEHAPDELKGNFPKLRRRI